MRLGVNLDYCAVGHTDFRFADLMAGAGNWVFPDAAHTNELASAEPLPPTESWLHAVSGYVEPGTYTITCQGTGTIRLGYPDLVGTDGARGWRDFTFPAPAGTTYTFPLSTARGQTFAVTVQDNSKTDPLRNLSIRTPNTRPDDFWHPDFVRALRPFGVLRSMDWLCVNASQIARWEDRMLESWTDRSATTPSVRPGFCEEGFLDLCNAADCDPWINLPHPCATLDGPTDYPTELGKLIAARVPASRTVYLEYTNECWNWSPPFWTQTHYCDQARAKIVNPRTGQPVGGGGAYGWLASQAFDAVEAAVSAARHSALRPRIVRVFAGQAAYVSDRGPEGFFRNCMDNVADFGWDVGAIACAPYSTWPKVDPFLQKTLTDLAAVDLPSAIGLLCEGMRRGVDQVVPWCEAWRKGADELGVPLLYYECGPCAPELWGNGTEALMEAAAADPRTAAMVCDYLAAIGGYALLGNYYSFCRPGVWGCLQDLGGVGTDQRYAGAVAYSARWGGRRPPPGPTPTPSPTPSPATPTAA